MGIVKTILTNVCQTYIIAGIQIKHVESDTAADLETAVKAVEVAILKGAERHPRAVVLDFPIGAKSQVAASIGLNGGLVTDEVLVLDEQGNFQIVEIVGKLTHVGAALSALLAIIESRLEEDRSAIGELSAYGNTDV